MLRYFLLLLFFASAYIFYSITTNDNSQPIAEKIESKPSFISSKSHMRNFNSMGQLYSSIFSDHAEYYKSIDQTSFVNPHIYYIPQNDLTNNIQSHSGEVWDIEAKQGTLNGHDNISLREDVIAKSNSQESMVSKIETQYLELDLTRNELRTPYKITFYGTNFTNTGKGLFGNLVTNKFELKEECHAIYKGFSNN